jgi:exodeoxyribonuclease V beta subunit
LVDDDAAARARMRARWSIVLVDEFQDTDPVQWEVLERAFAGHATLVLIGDPKQAIYAFRGGDVTTYLAAARTAGSRATLARNWRSDEALVAALHATIGDAELGDPEIVVHRVQAGHPGSRLAGAPAPAPLRLRVVNRYQLGLSARTTIRVNDARDHVAADLAADVAGLLGSAATFDGRPLVAGDVAVLVGTHAQATLARDALAVRGVPAVIAGSGSVYATAAADDWLVLLEALEQPHRSGRVRAAALTPFLGRSAADLAMGGDALTDELGGLLRTWADLLTHRGVAALLEVATTQQGLMQRLLAELNGERRLTDLRHVGQGLHAAAVEEGLGPAALVEWLRRRRAEAAGDATTERTRRLDSDAAAVQVVTLHASKGLQYPVVYLPFAFDRWVPTPDVLLLHDDDGRRVLDVGGPGSTGRSERETRAATEQAGEALRLLYVGLTRAQSQVVAWWAPSSNTPVSGLHRLLFGRTPGSSTVPERAPLPSDKDAERVLAELQSRGGPVVEPAVVAAAGGVPRPSGDGSLLAVRRFDRALDVAWRRMSYSSLAAAGDRATHDLGAALREGVASEPETTERADEALTGALGTAAGQPVGDPVGSGARPADHEVALRALPSPMADLPSGTAFGTLVHAVLEDADPQASDLRAELLARSREQLARRPSPATAEALAAALVPVLATPLGPVGHGLSLRDIPRRDRLAELDFELPLAGGDRPGTGAALRDLAPVLRRHLPVDDPLAGYASRLETPEVGWQSLRGYLTGSLDVVLRLPGPTYVVADYKTNWLGEVDGQPLTMWHYRPSALRSVMAASHYPLQALLYCVALHRYLRWRQPAYDPERHLGGALYLYVRGMGGAATPVVDGHPCGVFGWRPPAALVEDLSRLLDEGVA